MSSALLSPSRRVRRTPFSLGVERAGVRGYTVYNRMLLPTLFHSVEEDYRHLKAAVQVWDVACERQVELRGSDALRLMQMLTPRDLTGMETDRCYYCPVTDEAGGMLNDPVMLRVDEDRFWISLADSDLLLWVKGLALGMGLDVTVEEPDVAPLAVQGPLADRLMARVFGEAVTALPFFGFARFSFADTRFVVARSGYSWQGGFEIYVEGERLAMPLWDALMEAGRDLDVRAGCPNLIERIEGGLLSYGNDMTRADTPFHCGLGKFVTLDPARPCIGQDALLAARQPDRQIRALAIGGAAVPLVTDGWPVLRDGRPVGYVTSAAWSPDWGMNVAIAMIDRDSWADGVGVDIVCPDGIRPGLVRRRFFRDAPEALEFRAA